MQGRYKRATLSILGLYYLDRTIFDLMVYPQELNRDILVNSIVAECAELEILYQDPAYIKQLIGIWSQKELYNWQKLFETTQFVYNPIWNVDAHITEKEKRNRTGSFENSEDANNTNINAKTGYNSATFEDAERDNAIANIGRAGSDQDAEEIERTTERGGNIGVTMTQQLIEAEREVDKFNMYDYIIDSFKRRFCILLY